MDRDAGSAALDGMRQANQSGSLPLQGAEGGFLSADDADRLAATLLQQSNKRGAGPVTGLPYTLALQLMDMMSQDRHQDQPGEQQRKRQRQLASEPVVSLAAMIAQRWPQPLRQHHLLKHVLPDEARGMNALRWA